MIRRKFALVTALCALGILTYGHVVMARETGIFEDCVDCISSHDVPCQICIVQIIDEDGKSRACVTTSTCLPFPALCPNFIVGSCGAEVPGNGWIPENPPADAPRFEEPPRAAPPVYSFDKPVSFLDTLVAQGISKKDAQELVKQIVEEIKLEKPGEEGERLIRLITQEPSPEKPRKLSTTWAKMKSARF